MDPILVILYVAAGLSLGTCASLLFKVSQLYADIAGLRAKLRTQQARTASLCIEVDDLRRTQADVRMWVELTKRD